MGKTTDFVGRVTGVVIDAETLIDSGTWTPRVAGRMKKVRVIVGGIAATTLIENGYIKMSSSDFGGVDLYIPFNGIGLETVPRDHKPIVELECDLPVSKTPINVYYYFNVLPTTPELTIFADLET